MGIKKLWKEKKGRLIVIITLLFFALLFLFLLGRTTNTLVTEQAARRWSDNSFVQLSSFIPEHHGFTGDFSREITQAIESSFRDQGLDPHDPRNAWTFAYYAEGGVLPTRSHYRGPVTTQISGVGGNFFFFYPVTLVSGSYLPRESINRDLVFIDETLAWELFGAIDVTGMELLVSDRAYVIVGVFRHFQDPFSREASGLLPQAFFYYDELESVVGGLRITTVKALLPEPITALAQQIFTATLETAGLGEDDYLLVNHTERYRTLALLRVIGDFGSRSMQETGMRLPMWENAARMTEDFAALYLLLAILFSLFPLLCLFLLVIWKLKNRKWRVRKLLHRADMWREEKREAAWEKIQEQKEELQQRFTVDDIIRESRESEEENETDK